jgi:hypothetical protein
VPVEVTHPHEVIQPVFALSLVFDGGDGPVHCMKRIRMFLVVIYVENV